MYILKNSLVSIFRNKGRNILIGLIILTIACASTVTLAIRNTANSIVKNYEEAHDLIATLSFDRNQLMQQFRGGEDAQKENIEAFNNIESFTIDDVKNYGTSGAGGGNRPGGMEFGSMGERHTMTEKNTTTVITKSKKKFESTRNLTGDFQLDGYSSYDAMTNFVDGTYQIAEGEMISDFNAYQCVISSELATLNEVTVGSIITLKNPTTEATYDFTITGIYTDNNDNNETASMYSDIEIQI